ncbi:DUF805 domain-containing protein [Actinobacillus equuli]|uniref:DUF805 domain-containing protein n=1 Tax=Actinobacillus equuli TaxID=718 RepID=UPI0024188A5F|nr:DUF805 domain-containing protein [Actinobacillus equuli]MDG4953660.1 DUF805 domain-containing protein [Actinobacillus equuli subsp. equuli]
MRRSRLNYLVYSLLAGVSFVLCSRFVAKFSDYNNWEDYESAIKSVYVILILIIHLGIRIYLTVGRLKDMDKNPYWAWIVIIPFAWLYFVFAKGSVGDNQYGKSPKAIRDEKKKRSREQSND